MALANIIIKGRFRIEGKLGEGATAEVFKILDLNDGIL